MLVRSRVPTVMVASTALLLTCACGLAQPSADDPAPEVQLAVAAVVGGKPTAECDWPSTVDVNGCTGTLIHHRVVTTAAHCLSGRSSAEVTFTAGNDMPGSFKLTGTCRTGARGFFGGGGSRDWGYCVLPEDPRVEQFQITPPLVGCEAERFLKPGASAWVVGFGTTGSGLNDNGIKREVEVKVNRVSNGTIDIGDKDVGACHGDSGGPLYIKLSDGTHDWGYRVAGSTSGAGGNCDCACSTVYVNIAEHVKAIEENEDIDVTPCTDADGNWDPGEDCKEFQSDPQNATGTYPQCKVAVTTEPIATCGEPLASAAGMAGAGGAMSGSAGSAGGLAGAGSAGVAGGLTAGNGADASAGSGDGSLPTTPTTTPTTTSSMQPGAAGMGVVMITGTRGPASAAAGRGAPTQPAAAGALGQQVDAVLTAGNSASFGPMAEVNKPSGEGCQVSRVAAGGSSGILTLFATLLTGVFVRSWRPRRRARPLGKTPA